MLLGVLLVDIECSRKKKQEEMITKNIARNDNAKHKTQKIDNIKNDDIKNE
jgi:hypothetical protein